MPHSQTTQLGKIVNVMKQRSPTSILDVGVGMGVYGFLARMFVNLEDLFYIDGEHSRYKTMDERTIRIDGIEGFAKYLNPVHDFVYNRMMTGNALDILPTIPAKSYDMVLAIDILEHFTREDGLTFLAELKRVAKKSVLVSTPKEFIEQHIELNHFEDHLSLWSQQDLMEAGFGRQYDNPISWIAEHVIR